MSQPRKDESYQDLYYYKPLHILAKTFGILPFFDIHNLEKAPKWPPFNGFLAIIAYSTIFIYSTIGKWTVMWFIFPATVFMTDYGGDLAMLSINLTGIIRVCLIKSNQIKKFLNNMKMIDVELRSFGTAVKYPRTIFLLEFIFTNILFFVYYAYDAYTWIDSVTFNIYKMFVFRDMQCFHMVVLSMIIRNYSLAIRNRMRNLNEILLKMRPSIDEQEPHKDQRRHSLIKTKINRANIITMMADSGQKKSNNSQRVKKVYNDVLRMRRIYARICTSMAIFNDIFGWIYLVSYMAIVVYLLTSTNIALVYGVGNKIMGTSEFGWPLIILCVLWGALPLIVGIFIFSSADKVFFEIKRTPVICYSIIDGWLPFDDEHLLVPELEKFAQQVTNSHPEIVAAGFFEVDFAIFFALIGSMSSYVIVLIQFMDT